VSFVVHRDTTLTLGNNNMLGELAEGLQKTNYDKESVVHYLLFLNMKKSN